MCNTLRFQFYLRYAYNRNTLWALSSMYKTRGRKMRNKRVRFESVQRFYPQLKSPSRYIVLPSATFGRVTKAIKKSSHRARVHERRRKFISWRLISNCAINDSDKCVKTAIVVIETHPSRSRTLATAGRYGEGLVGSRADSPPPRNV